MNPSSLSDVYDEMIGFPIFLIVVFFIPLFVFIFRSMKKRNVKPIIRKSFYVAYPMLVLLLFMDIIIGPWKFKQLCETVVGFHGTPFPKEEGLLLPNDPVTACSLGCRSKLETGLVGFVEEELREPVPEQFRDQSIDRNMVFQPGKYRYYIHYPDDPACAGRPILDREGGILDAEFDVYWEYCITGEKIDEFEARYLYDFIDQPESSQFHEYISSGFFTPYGISSIWIQDRQTNEIVAEYVSAGMGKTWLERKVSLALIGIGGGGVAYCGYPQPISVHLFVGWEPSF